MGRDAKAFIVETLETPGKPGAVQFVRDNGKITGWNHACPCGCGSWSYMGLDPDSNTEHATWKIETGSLEDFEHLTLSPSVGIKPLGPSGYHWHGWFRNGVFVEG